MDRRIQISHQVLSTGQSDALQRALAMEYEKGSARALCLCKHPGVELYIAKFSGKFVLKRMPGSGSLHHPICESFEPPPEVSGLGQLLGSAIIEDPNLGKTTLRLGFSLVKDPTREPPKPTGIEKDSVVSDSKKLSMRSTLEFLWEQAGFHKWVPKMAGKRHFGLIRYHLMQAATHTFAKKKPLDEVLWMPEIYRGEHADDIRQRRMAQWMAYASPLQGKRQLLLGIGEIREYKDMQQGMGIFFKHADQPLYLDKKAFEKLHLLPEMQMCGQDPSLHLMCIATFGVTPTGLAYINECALMMTNEHYVPVYDIWDLELISQTIKSERRFIKGLRYNLEVNKPVANLVLSDTDAAVAIFVKNPRAGELFDEQLADLCSSLSFRHAIWNPSSNETIPDILKRFPMQRQGVQHVS